MAEIDIIALWNKGKPSQGSIDVDVDRLISKKSKTPLYWIKFILWIEFAINLVCLPITLIFWREEDPMLYGVITPLIIVIYLIYYQFLIQKINAFDFSRDVKTSLRKLYSYLNFFLLHYRVIIWLSLVVGYVYGLITADEQGSEMPNDMTGWVVIVGIGILFIGLVGFILNWLISLIYGKKIKRLKEVVKDFETIN